MRAFYRLPLPLPETGLPAGVELSEDSAHVWVLADTDPSPTLEALGGVRLGARLSELTGADLDACQNPDSPGVPRTIFAGDALEDYQ